jgi:hypothetical protein
MNIPLAFMILSSLWLIAHVFFYKDIINEHKYIHYAWISNCIFLILIDMLSIIQLCSFEGKFILMFTIFCMMAFLGVSFITAMWVFHNLIVGYHNSSELEVEIPVEQTV